MCVNPYMFTIVKAVKKLTFNSCILYFIFGGNITQSFCPPIPTKNQISEIKTQTKYKLLYLMILVIFEQLKQNEYKKPI